MANVTETIKTGAQHHQSGRLQQVEQLYAHVLQTQPQNPFDLHLLGLLAHQEGNNDLALELITMAIANYPHVPQFYNNLAVILKALGKFDEAVEACGKALELKPKYTQAHYNAANSFETQDNHNDAIDHYEQALLTTPQDADIYNNMGVALQKNGQHTEAVDSFRYAIGLKPDYATAYKGMAASLQNLGRPEEAIDAFRQALHFEPDCVQAHSDMGMVMLLTGDFTQGWTEYEWRLHDTKCTSSFYQSATRWDGSDFTGKKLLIRFEQGLGDTIQFVRYLPMVKARGGTVVLEVHEPLFDLLKDFRGVDELIKPSLPDQLPADIDLYIPLLDLPRIFATTLDTIPANVPYIHANSAKVAHWKNSISGRCLKVGIIWAGSPGHRGDSLRSCKLEHFAPLAAIDGVKLYGLQKGPGSEQIECFDKFPIINLGKGIENFTDTAAAIENLDLVISVDTAVLHLAGAMGRTAWALLPFANDWRWLLSRDDSPWYPTMRLFRQRKANDWEELFRRVSEELKTLVSLNE